MIRADGSSGLADNVSLQGPMLVGTGMMALTILLGLFLFVGFEEVLGAMERPYLVPWVIATGIILVAPLIYLHRRGEFLFIHPLVLITVTYLLPIFFLGGWSLVFGWSDYYYLNYIDNPRWSFQLTYLYIIVGCASLSLGVLLPFGRRVGARLGKLLPSWDFDRNELIVLGIAFLGIGIVLVITAIDSGAGGYQLREFDDVQEVGSLQAFLALILPSSLVFLWIAFFRSHQWTLGRALLLAFLIGGLLFLGVSSGAKAGLMSGFIGILVAFTLARRRLRVGQWVLVGFASMLLLFVGFAWASTFRVTKGYERTSAAEYYNVAIDSLGALAQTDPAQQFSDFVAGFLERVEIASSLAVVVSNHEVLARYEQAYGLENNIWNATWLGFIPRFIWTDKPVIGDTRAFNELYLDTEWSGFAVTAFGDLLRNFGPLGVPIGMFLLGVALRILYSTLIESGSLESWKGVLFYAILTQVSLEGFFGHILPGAIRLAAVVGLQIVVMRGLVLLYRGVGSKPL